MVCVRLSCMTIRSACSILLVLLTLWSRTSFGRYVFTCYCLSSGPTTFCRIRGGGCKCRRMIRCIFCREHKKNAPGTDDCGRRKIERPYWQQQMTALVCENGKGGLTQRVDASAGSFDPTREWDQFFNFSDQYMAPKT